MQTPKSNTPPRTLYVSDLDGTLMTPEARISPASAALINDAIASGALFTVATARTPATLDPILAPLNLNLPAIVLTGGLLWLGPGKGYRFPQFFPEEQVRRILEEYRRRGFSSFYFGLEDDVLQVYHTGPLSPLEQQFIDERRDSPYKNFHIPESGESPTPERLDNILLFYAFRPNAEGEPAFDAIKGLPHITPLAYHDNYGPEILIIEIFPETTSKALGIKRLAQDLEADRVVVFGDNLNDIPMFEIADVAVAVENALPEVKSHADVVIGRNTDDAVAKFIHSHTIGAAKP